MKNKTSFFNLASKTFWALIALVVVLSLLHLDFGIFRTNKVADEIAYIDTVSTIILTDTIHQQIDSTKKNEFANYTWKWSSFDGKKYQLNFSINKNLIIESSERRSSSSNVSTELYRGLYSFDRMVLANMVLGYKNIIRQEGLNYYSALNMVVTSIQSIPYTLVLNSAGIEYRGEMVKCPCQTNFGYFKGKCAVLADGKGCCNDVEPWGVYSPVEFATRRTGDCDTRSLFAFTILKELGYDVAIMGSEEEGHSVLGVKVSGIPGDGIRGSDIVGRDYFLWELTSYGHKLGTNVGGNDWIVNLK